ncbi:hypothetical protein UCRNP2_8619 [Neofusicoccum parvum UCRNP2]|uniref:Vacuolar ATPase assembly protein VMA22 n=1 Tax=Botryosphaeria parva (strain UCR-NP2) TaxID=1287680 RepID=R1G911_BOTPV|nr:hypothetical protein UCRNP2_8619 [Neofusicoccum parvum UCRNP2]
MTEVAPIPPPTAEIDEKVSSSTSRETLVSMLDELLKRYLLLLDQYTQARQQLSSDLSSGYISLAQANFNASNRVRYGQDFYDERMQALRRVTIEEENSKLTRTLRLADPPTEPADADTPADGSADEPGKSPSDPTDPVSASVAKLDLNDELDNDGPEDDSSASVEKDGNKTAEAPKTPAADGRGPRPDDPIRWFGILVPPALRCAQSSFVRAVEGPVPRIVGLAAELRELEIEVGRARKAIRKSSG